MFGYKYKNSWLFLSRLRSIPIICLDFLHYLHYMMNVRLIWFASCDYNYHLFGKAMHRAATATQPPSILGEQRVSRVLNPKRLNP